MIGRGSRPHNLLHGCNLQYLALVLVHECLSEEVLVHFLRKVLQYDIHHDLPIEIPRVYHVIHVQTLPRIQPLEGEVVGRAVDEDQAVDALGLPEVVEERPVDQVAQDAPDHKGENSS